MMTEPWMSLAAAAERLRQENSAPWHYGGRPCELAVADLIDGTLAIWSEAVDRYERYELGAQSGADAMEDVVALLVPLVRAFLPDWNPDTEETP
jgi:hypothetical protein